MTSQLLKKIGAQPELTWLAMMDGAFDHGKASISLVNERHALYDCDGMSDLLAASPFLIALTAQDESRLRLELAALARHRKERPMLSFISTPSQANAVNENFRLFANAVTEDGQEFLLRFADTRVLPGIPDALRQTYWDGMTGLLSEWIIIDRVGQLQSLPLNANRCPLQGSFQLSPVEFATLVTQGEPDAILDVIAETNPEALPGLDRAAIYEKVAGACAFAHEHGVRAFPDLVALAYLALLNDGKGLKMPKLSEMLLRLEWSDGNLINCLSDYVT
ncbi:DUF4123 domain-containing protein [Massilia yuzhufengensis]|nr:DUF4123 domain-containing protein [Massilia yuzhufengensis]